MDLAEARPARAEIVEADIPNVTIGQEVEIQPEGDPDKTYVGKVLCRAAVFGARKLASDDPSQRSDERVVEVVVSADGAPLLVGQRVLVKFMKPGQKAGVKRDKPTPPVASAATVAVRKDGEKKRVIQNGNCIVRDGGARREPARKPQLTWGQ